MGYCIRLAYELNWVNPFELGGPAWLDPPTLSEYDIVARTGSPVSSDQTKAMLRTLLKERFKLAVHRERRDLPAYDLVLGSGEPNLRASDAGAERKVTFEGREKWVFHHFSMADLALQLGPPMMSRTVVDKTELAGPSIFGWTWRAI